MNIEQATRNHLENITSDEILGSDALFNLYFDIWASLTNKDMTPKNKQDWAAVQNLASCLQI